MMSSDNDKVFSQAMSGGAWKREPRVDLTRKKHRPTGPSEHRRRAAAQLPVADPNQPSIRGRAADAWFVLFSSARVCKTAFSQLKQGR
jgi:hypothetical protein